MSAKRFATAAGRYAVSYLVLDEGMLSRHGLGFDVAEVARARLETGAFRLAYASTFVHVLALVPGPEGPAPQRR